MHGESCEPIIKVDGGRNQLQTLIATDIRKNIIKAIECLPEREKMVLTLYYQEDLNLKEIGAVLNVEKPRVSQPHSQAIKRLRVRLNPDK